jgi:dolichyl-phosphate beta-glucosyltransferase
MVAAVGVENAFSPASGAPEMLSLVIPAYNEEERLPALLETLAADADRALSAAGLRLLEIVIVDDGSTDRTREMLAAAAADNPRLTPVIDFAENRGKGAAFAAGVARARGRYVLLADVDLSTPLEELGKLTAAIDAGADIAIGSRAVPGAVVERGPLHRKLLGHSFNGAVRLLTGLDLRDTQNGFKLFPTEALRQLTARQTCPGFAFDVELLMRADRVGLRIAEVPIVYVHDPRSSVRVGSAGLEMLKDVSGLAYRIRLREGRAGRALPRRPLADFKAEDAD